ncbi:hypothetical protein CPB86DRAFT_693935 [Serendipita vermifera]|nr:hypothetical protein CPB86DRAFT_693935 [Serendipita vermifera]
MEGFDPLFDDEPISTPNFTLSLPTFESQPPEYVVPSTRSGTDPYIFDENVGTIALIGSHCSEQSLPFSNSTTGSTKQAKLPTQQPKRYKPPRKRGPSKDVHAQRQHKPYHPTSAQDLVLSQLAKDPNIVPLLQSIVEYIYRRKFASAQTSPLPKETDSSCATPRPTKKRRLHRVPAGAEGWVIPFPFQEGEGPLHYKETWEMKRLVLLLGSLMQSLRDWRNCSRNVSINPRPKEGTEHIASCSATPSHEPSQAHDSTFAGADLFSQINIPNPSEFDSSLEALLNIFSAYDGQHDSALNVDLGALGTGGQISDILYTTPVDASQTVPWDQYLTFEPPLSQVQSSQSSTSPSTPIPINFDIDPDIVMLDPQLAAGQYDRSSSCIDANVNIGDGYGGAASNFLPNTLEQCVESLNPQYTSLGLNVEPLNLVHRQDMLMREDTPQSLVEDIPLSSNATSVPSLTASPSISMELDIPKITGDVQTRPLGRPRTNPGISALSKRGKARSTAVLRRDLKRSGHAPMTGSSGPSIGPQETRASVPASNKLRDPKAHSRVNEGVLERRRQLLEQAKEWKEMIAADLEKARTLGWEAMMEGIVLREAGLILRNPSSN